MGETYGARIENETVELCPAEEIVTSVKETASVHGIWICCWGTTGRWTDKSTGNIRASVKGKGETSSWYTCIYRLSVTGLLGFDSKEEWWIKGHDFEKAEVFFVYVFPFLFENNEIAISIIFLVNAWQVNLQLLWLVKISKFSNPILLGSAWKDKCLKKHAVDTVVNH